MTHDFFSQVLTTRLPPMLAQNITVLWQQKPELYQKGLFCAVLTSVSCRALGMDREQCTAGYLAGIVHDVGLLHIPPEITNKKDTLEAHEWRAVQSHVVIGRLMLERMPGVPPETPIAILEHHERCDGSGYPTGRTEGRLGLLGQVLGMADSLQAIRVNQFAEHGLNLVNALPYLQMNNTTHGHDVYEAVSTAIKRSGVAPTAYPATGEAGKFAQNLLHRGTGLAAVVAPLDRLYALIAELDLRGKLDCLFRMADRVRSMLASSGLLHEELTQWLEGVKNGQDSGSSGELTAIELMQNELSWQLNNLKRTLNEVLELDQPAVADVADSLRLTLQEISTCLQQLAR